MIIPNEENKHVNQVFRYGHFPNFFIRRDKKDSDDVEKSEQMFKMSVFVKICLLMLQKNLLVSKTLGDECSFLRKTSKTVEKYVCIIKESVQKFWIIIWTF